MVKGAIPLSITAAADGDGCDYTGGAGGTVTVDHATFTANMPLAETETVTLTLTVSFSNHGRLAESCCTSLHALCVAVRV